jgi:geranylgeranyl pyrophosphate synthase
MWQRRQVELLDREIKTFLRPLANIPGLYDLVKEPLGKARRGLAAASKDEPPWILLPLIVCESIRGDYAQALPAAAAIQLLMAAGDVFDDIEDADASEAVSAKYGPAIATNVATTLLILAEQGLTRLKAKGVKDSITVRVIHAVNSFYVTACAGQHLDLSLAPDSVISEDMYFEVIAMKSASQVECACHVGALLAGAKHEIVNKFSQFGRSLGMAAQITNDIHGIVRGNDIIRRKITLPVIYVLTHADGQAHNYLKLLFSKQSGASIDPASIKELLFRTGAIHYATMKMEFYRQQAENVLYSAESSGANVERLKLFLK